MGSAGEPEETHQLGIKLHVLSFGNQRALTLFLRMFYNSQDKKQRHTGEAHTLKYNYQHIYFFKKIM